MLCQQRQCSSVRDVSTHLLAHSGNCTGCAFCCFLLLLCACACVRVVSCDVSACLHASEPIVLRRIEVIPAVFAAAAVCGVHPSGGFMGRAAHAGWLPHALPAQGVRGGMQRADPTRNAMQRCAMQRCSLRAYRARSSTHERSLTAQRGAERSPFVGLYARATVVHTFASALAHPRWRIRFGASALACGTSPSDTARHDGYCTDHSQT